MGTFLGSRATNPLMDQGCCHSFAPQAHPPALPRAAALTTDGEQRREGVFHPRQLLETDTGQRSGGSHPSVLRTGAAGPWEQQRGRKATAPA